MPITRTLAEITAAWPCRVPLAELGRRVLTNAGRPAQSRGWSTWKRKYPSVAAWIAAHPDTPAARVLQPGS